MLSTELLLKAYCVGAFPMAVNAQGEIAWFSPDPRALIPLDERFHVPHGLRRRLKQHTYQISVDSAFETVIRACAQAHRETWISRQIIDSYCELHREGYAHSLETWRAGELAGGLYGVHLGGAFFGESMFHYAPDASKVALVGLVERLRERGFVLLDTQWRTPHLAQFGTFLVPREEYRQRLCQALALERQFD